MNTPFNLLHEPWLPVQRRDGRREWIAPAQITDDLQRNPVVDVDWPRPDLRVATYEFLIGLLATACPPADEEEWLERWNNPLAPDELAAAFAPLASAFDLDGSGPRFMQDLDAVAVSDTGNTIEQLLIEAPGEQTIDDNKTLFVKANRIEQLSRATAAIALYTLQTYAPSGGSGNLTSLRGGGPLTTLALPGGVPSLWNTLWANVPQGKRPAARDLPRAFPWLAPTRTADRYPATSPAQAHPLQAFWGMPRRIRLAFTTNEAKRPCDLIGTIDAVHVTGWGQRPNGIKYVAWDHPLAPAYKDTKGGGWLPVHPQADGIGYRHWAALVAGDMSGNRRPAPIIVAWQTRQLDLSDDVRDARLFAAGYDTDNMKARGFVESEMPLPGTADAATAGATAFLAQHLIAAAEIVAQKLRSAVRKTVRKGGDVASATTAYEALWAATQGAFFQTLRDVVQPAGAPVEHALKGVAQEWQQRLSGIALRLFAEAAPLDLSSGDPARIVSARRGLSLTTNGYGADGKKLFSTLLLSAPTSKKSKARKSA